MKDSRSPPFSIMLAAAFRRRGSFMRDVMTKEVIADSFRVCAS